MRDISSSRLILNNCGLLEIVYTEFTIADGSGRPRYENMKTRRVRIESKTNKRAYGE